MTTEERKRAKAFAKDLILKGRKLKDIERITNLSKSTIKRIKRSIKDDKPNISKQVGRKRALTEDEENIIITFYIEHASSFNFKHFYEHFVINQMGYNISYPTLLRIFKKRKITSPESRKQTLRSYKRSDVDNKGVNENISELSDKEISFKHELCAKYAHPYVSAPKYFGEIVETDASIHLWFNNKKAALHIFVDKATSIILGAHFEEQETLKGYYTAFKQVLINYGIPYQLKADNRTVFKYNEDSEKKTNFAIMCNFLGIDLVTTSVAQAKGTVERCFKTLQSRLASELNFYGIKTIDEANNYLAGFLKDYNSKLLSKLDDIGNRFVNQEYNEDKLNKILSVFNQRIVSGHCISYEKKKYIPLKHNGEKMYLYNKTKVVVVKSLVDTLHILLENQIYDLVEIEDYEEFSKNFNEKKEEEPKEKEKYIPPADHPWRKFFKNLFDELTKKRKK
ncbi:ISNCY family transposase [Oceanivirga miroungae]|uniref:Integrase catalytic domain-containing protein n=1 Tax=Oceanivirga miroungae TaxID=1130046 RepID=A0A6I8MCL1_9FUSO|nr:ISNCY family transposase [Oceanivirga miroungae]VWL89653.1 hypothetical protein OMES3154_01287 [Oceanivirga miroungae]